MIEFNSHPFLNLWFYNKFYTYFQHFLGIKQIAFAHICVILMVVCCFMGFFKRSIPFARKSAESVHFILEDEICKVIGQPGNEGAMYE